jgi:photosystem II stability/assembly factor-like uncharacterized protein
MDYAQQLGANNMIAHRLYVGTVGEGVFLSTDQGQSFRRAAEGMFVECTVRALVVDGQDPATLYLGNEQGVWLSRDGAESWHRLLPLAGQAVWALRVCGQRLVVGTCPPRLLRSGDAGKSWQDAAVTMAQDCPRIIHNRVTAIVHDPDRPECLWAGVEIDGVQYSQDGGKTWQPQGTGLSSRDIHALAVVSSRRLVATTNNDLNTSDDGGWTWQAAGIDRVLPWKYTRALAQLAGQPQVLLLGGGDRPPGWAGAMARSQDGGRTWKSVRMPRANSTMWNFAVHAADGKLVYASSVSGQLFRSTDGGMEWDKLDVEFGEVRALAWSPGL